MPRAFVTLLLGCLLWLTACGGTKHVVRGGSAGISPTSPSPADDKDPPGHTLTLEREDQQSASQAFMEVVSEEEEAMMAALWRQFERAEIHSDIVGARAALAEMVALGHETKEGFRARIQLATYRIDRLDWLGALGWIEGLDDPQWHADDHGRFEMYRIEAQAREGVSEYGKAADAWLESLSFTHHDAARSEILLKAARALFLDARMGEARNLLAEHGVDPAVLQTVFGQDVSSEVLTKLAESLLAEDEDAPWIALQWLRRRCDSVSLDGCLQAIDTVTEKGFGISSEVVQAYRDRAYAWNTIRARRLGVILPLSGPYRELGAAALQAIRLVLANYPDTDLIVRDSEGRKEKAAAQAETLIMEEHVIAILGPIGAKESRSAAEVSNHYGVPHLVLSSSPETVKGLNHTLRFRISAAEQAAFLAGYAADILGVQKVAMLLPKQSGQALLMTAFWDAFVRHGGEVVAVEQYLPSERDFSALIQGLVSTSQPGLGVEVNFDALYIPGKALTVRRMVPFLKYLGVLVRSSPKGAKDGSFDGAQLLGSAEWNSVSVIDRGDNLTDNAVFVDAFFRDGPTQAARDFVISFRGVYEQTPTSFHAEVYDATQYMLERMRRIAGNAQVVRRELDASLRNGEAFHGVTGLSRFGIDGSVSRKPLILTVDLDTIRLRVSEENELKRRRHRQH